jgi:hypothetical protein
MYFVNQIQYVVPPSTSPSSNYDCLMYFHGRSLEMLFSLEIVEASVASVIFNGFGCPKTFRAWIFLSLLNTPCYKSSMWRGVAMLGYCTI